ncbi:MAG: hypothetical protein RMK73_13915 [Geminicoccaceae bacterium]|nr:hypothetical protein [Geminicoccaceae bacterium]MDW8342574.1 hypothetical protein [Geminicoccaceae bacterium]
MPIAVDPPGSPVPAGPTRLFPLARAGGRLPGDDPQATFDSVRGAVLAWLERRVGKIPPEARRFGPFVLDRGGTVAEVAAWSAPEAEIWAARLRYPDDREPGRVWRTESTILRTAREVRALVRLDVADRRAELALDVFSVPRLVRWIVRRHGLSMGGWALPHGFRRGVEGAELAQRLADPERPVPAILLSVPDRGEPAWAGVLDPGRLARRLAGLAEVHVVSPEAARTLERVLGERWRCFGGAVRLFRAPFRAGEDAPSRHPLFVPDQIRSFRSAADLPFDVHLSLLVGRESLASRHPDLELPTFARVQERMREQEFARARAEAKPTDELLALAEEENRALRARLEAQRRDWEALLALAERERDEARSGLHEALSGLHGAYARIATLEAQLRGQGRDPDREVPALSRYAELASWAERHLAGRLVLLPRAIREARDGLFEDVALVGRALLYLAGPYRRMRIEGGEAARRANAEALAELGIENSAVGGDLERFPERFRVVWRGQNRLLDFHVKKGNARDPRRCLRIYYFWDEQEALVVVGSLPGHIRTGAS